MLWKVSGLTLIELLVTLVIAGTLNAMAAPYFSELLSSLRTYRATHSLRIALTTARSDALNRRRAVRICPSRDGETCDSTLRWENGWISYEASAGTLGRSEGKPVIQQGMAQPGAAIRKNGTETTVMFDRNGRVGLYRSFHICDSRKHEPVMRIILNLSGRIRITKKGVKCFIFAPQLLDQMSLYA